MISISIRLFLLPIEFIYLHVESYLVKEEKNGKIKNGRRFRCVGSALDII